jgi:hypothetical protein
MNCTVHYGEALEAVTASTVQRVKDIHKQIRLAEASGNHEELQNLALELSQAARQDTINAAAHLVEELESAISVLKTALKCFAEDDDVAHDMLDQARHEFKGATHDVAVMMTSMMLRA